MGHGTKAEPGSERERGEIEQIGAHRPFIGTRLLAFVALTGPLEQHAASVVTDAANGFDFFCAEALLRQGGEFFELRLDGARAFSGFLDEGGDHAFNGRMAEVPDAGELQER